MEMTMEQLKAHTLTHVKEYISSKDVTDVIEAADITGDLDGEDLTVQINEA